MANSNHAIVWPIETCQAVHVVAHCLKRYYYCATKGRVESSAHRPSLARQFLGGWTGIVWKLRGFMVFLVICALAQAGVHIGRTYDSAVGRMLWWDPSMLSSGKKSLYIVVYRYGCTMHEGWAPPPRPPAFMCVKEFRVGSFQF